MKVSSVLFASVNFRFLPLRFSEQNVRIGAGRCIGVTSDYLFVLLRAIRARQRG